MHTALATERAMPTSVILCSRRPSTDLYASPHPQRGQGPPCIHQPHTQALLQNTTQRRGSTEPCPPATPCGEGREAPPAGQVLLMLLTAGAWQLRAGGAARLLRPALRCPAGSGCSPQVLLRGRGTVSRWSVLPDTSHRELPLREGLGWVVTES